MEDNTEQPEEQGNPNNNKWLLGGIGFLVLAGGAYVLFSSDQESQWGNTSETEQTAGDIAQDSADAPEAIADEPAIEDREVRGIVQAAEEATIASRMTAQITAMPFRVGSSFGRGAVLVRLDCSQLQAQARAADAATSAYQTTHDTNVELDQYEAVGRNEVAVSEANLGRARAEAAAIRAQLSDCSVRAPFSGTVVEEIGHRGEVAASGQPLLKIQSGGALEAELIVPSTWLTWVGPGATFGFTLDETGQRIQGTVKRLGASVDPVSKTIRVTGDLLPEGNLVLPGMSGTAVFEQPEPVVEAEPVSTANAEQEADGNQAAD